MAIDAVLNQALLKGASDVHVVVGVAVWLRIQGSLSLWQDMLLSEDEVLEFVYLHANTRLLDTVKDFSCTIEKGIRLRVCVYRDRYGLNLAIRVLVNAPPELLSYQHHEFLLNAISVKTGLILITGATGSGKSTTMAAMIDHLNQTQPLHIISFEDPIEYCYVSDKSLIHQLEFGQHYDDVHAALKSALRQDPDVLSIGEIRDLPMLELALYAAQTGHLVLATMHSANVSSALVRLIDGFAHSAKHSVATMLSESLRAIICQRWQNNQGDQTRQLEMELLMCNDAVKHIIRSQQLSQLKHVMYTGASQGMCCF